VTLATRAGARRGRTSAVARPAERIGFLRAESALLGGRLQVIKPLGSDHSAPVTQSWGWGLLFGLAFNK